MSGETSFLEYLRRVEESTEPLLAFKAETLDGWAKWRLELRDTLKRLIALPEDRVAVEVDVAEVKSCEGYTRKKITYKVEPRFRVPAYLLIPKRGGEKPGVLALHGHGRGKDDVAGIYRNEVEYQRFIAPLNYDYGVRLAKRGYVVLAPDGRCFGELASDGVTCTWGFTASLLLGRTLVGLRVWDAMKAIDVLQSMSEVDPERIGCLGLSWGGTWTSYLSALDERVKTAVISGYFGTFRDMLIERGCCPCQYIPKVRLYADFPDIVSLIAPRPLLIEYGLRDPLYTKSVVLRAYESLKRVYSLLGADEKLAMDMFDGGHMFHGVKAFKWLDKWLKNT